MSKDLINKSVVNFGQDLNGITQNAVFPEHLNEYTYRPKTLVDETLENIDPTPDVHNMFLQFNQLFFWNKLDSIYVKWSKRMTTCAGTCTFHPRSRECVITLSAPLLKLRPRKDLVETLLHEMIHGYLFITNNNRDRDGHGPEFCKHMHRINKASGTNITIYHTFHDEVRLYQQHWWKCDGPCSNKPPYFGTVRRAMNRAPGPSDFWWKDHQFNCGGNFIKIREPEKPATTTKSRSKSTSNTNSKNNNTSIKSPPKNITKPLPNQKTLDKFIKNNKNNSSSSDFVSGAENLNKLNTIHSSASSAGDGFKKLGNSTNNVFGFGTGGPGSQSSVKTQVSSNSDNKKKSISFSGTTGGNSTGKSRLLDLYSPPKSKNGKQTPEVKMISDGENNDNNDNNSVSGIECPICNQTVFDDINRHIDECLTQESLPKRRKIDDNQRSSDEKNSECPICNNTFLANEITAHIDVCLSISNDETPPRVAPSAVPAKKNKYAASKVVPCPICNESFSNTTINDHVELCLSQTETERNVQVGASSNHHLPSSMKRSDVINCCTCERNINSVDYYEHVQKCLRELTERRSQRNEIIEIPDSDNMMASCSSSNGNIKLPSSPHYKCLVCNELISKNIPLEEHLDVCVKVMFHDSDDSADNSMIAKDVNSKDAKLRARGGGDDDDKQICPICMELISDKLIAAHVNKCDKFRL